MKFRFFLIAATFASLTITLCCGKANNQDPLVQDPEEQPELPVEPLKDEDVVFANSFEDGNLDVWDDWDGNHAPATVLIEQEGPRKQAGNHVLRLRAKPGRGGADVLKMLPGGPHEKLYARWYVYWEEGYDFKARNHGSGFAAGARANIGKADNRPKGDDFAAMWIEPNPKFGNLNLYCYYRGMHQNCANPVGSCWGDNFPCMQDDGKTFCITPEHRPQSADKRPPVLTGGKWYCVELMMDMGNPSTDGKGATGAFNFWIDGKQYGPWNNLWMRTTKDLTITALWLNLFHHEEHSVEGMFYDDVVVAKKRIGTAVVKDKK